MKKILYKFIFFTLMGWRIKGFMDPEIKKSVLMIVPHTSWLDFMVGLFARGIIGMEMHYVAKKELFRFPFGAYFRWMGGAPLDRAGNLDKVDAIAKLFGQRKVFRMAIAPEGTRKKVAGLKTGFYYIALKSGVPIIPVAFDYGKKTVDIAGAFHPTGNIDADLKVILRHFKETKGRFPENSFDVSPFL
jgi:1-acyl-sn-glycerol-3-phosphate acyltransferase